jgi:hypothetical protein
MTAAAAKGAPMDEPIVIVSGLPRSGTSMMMQMLAAGGLPLLTDDVRVADEDNPRGYYELESVKNTRRDACWLDQARGRATKIVHLLLWDLPTNRSYRVILMRRRMQEVLASQAAMLARRGQPGASLAADELGRVMDRQLNQVVSYLQSQPCFSLLEVHYDQVVRFAEREAEAVNRFLGGRLDTCRMAAAVDPLLYRQQR